MANPILTRLKLLVADTVWLLIDFKDREVGTNPGQKWLRYLGVQGMKYS